MSVETVTLFLALLACVAFVMTLLALVSRATGDRFGFLQTVEPLRFELMASIATTATLGSLYLSEGAGFEPCRLCWIQRGFMYPSAVLLLVAVAVKREVFGSGRSPFPRWASFAAGGLSSIGLLVAIFHRYEQEQGGIGSVCDPAVPCSSRWLNHFGFMTIPTMAGIGFAAIVTFAFAYQNGRSHLASTVIENGKS